MSEKLNSNTILLDWSTLRVKLNDQIDADDNWNKAIKLIETRVKERYFDPIFKLIDQPNTPTGEGFSIVSIECILIEFLSACVDGMIYKNNFNPAIDPAYYYRASGIIFERFLNTADMFDGIFYNNTGLSQTITSNDFYINVRCALLHEAYTRNRWKINVLKTREKDKFNKEIIKINGSNKIIYRTALFYGIKDYFNIYYLTSLKESSIKGQQLRKNLGRKLDHIAELFVTGTNDGKYWWTP